MNYYLTSIESLAAVNLSKKNALINFSIYFKEIPLTFKKFLSLKLYLSIKRGKNLAIGWVSADLLVLVPRLKGIGTVLF